MKTGRLLRAAAVVGCSIILFSSGLVASTGTARADDGNGREWRQLYETTGLSWNEVADICPRDGVTPCSGSSGGRVLTGWVWATDAQVIELMSGHAPEILTAEPPSVSGPEYLVAASDFLTNVMRPTLIISGYPFYSESTSGWTSSLDAESSPLEGRVGFGWPPPGGSFGVGPAWNGGEADANRGVWLWRPAGDYSPPVITPDIVGTAGSNGWHVSDVSVAWAISDPESPIDSTTGCDPASVTADTSGAMFSCEATSAGGTSQATAIVKRDATAPALACGSPAPVLNLGQLGAKISASVTDATSGPATPTASAFVNANAPGSFTAAVTGRDRAGNSRTTNCPYEVVVPPCLTLSPTLVGTLGNDVISGTSGPDIIQALGGNDTIYGKDGNDVICGGQGLDVIDAGKGNDRLGGDGGPDTIYGGAGRDTANGGSGDDSLFGSGGDDRLDGGANNDSIRGEDGRDTCTSGEIRMSSCEVILP